MIGEEGHDDREHLGARAPVVGEVPRDRATRCREYQDSHGSRRSRRGALGLLFSVRVGGSALAEANDVLVSSTLRDLVIGSGLEFDDRGAHQLKGVPGEWHLFAVATPSRGFV